MYSSRVAASVLLLACAGAGVAFAQDYPTRPGGSEAATGTPAELMAKFRSDDARMRKLFRQIGLSPDK